MRIRDRKKRLYIGFRIVFIVLITAMAAFIRYTCAFPRNITVELGRSLDFKASDFLYWGEWMDKELVTDLEAIEEQGKCGDYDIEIEYHDLFFDNTLHANLTIQDTTAPAGRTAIKPVHYQGAPFEYDSLFIETFDKQDVRVELVGKYDLDKEGMHDLRVLLIDESNNFREYAVSLETQIDALPPVISSVPTLYLKSSKGPASITEDLDYYDNVTAKEDITVSVDDSKVRYNAQGIYSAAIKLEDECGNISEYTRKVEVYSLDNANVFAGAHDAELDSMIDSIYYSITNDSMSDWQKIQACYWWMVNNLKYRASHDYSFLDDPQGTAVPFAKNLLSSRRGACFAYASVFGYFMNKIGLPVVLLIGNGANAAGGFELHCWNLVFYEGHWYHCDPMYPQLYAYQLNFFMVSSGSLYNRTHLWNTNIYPWY